MAHQQISFFLIINKMRLVYYYCINYYSISWPPISRPACPRLLFYLFALLKIGEWALGIGVHKRASIVSTEILDKTEYTYIFSMSHISITYIFSFHMHGLFWTSYELAFI